MTDLRVKRRNILSRELRAELAARNEREALTASIHADLAADGSLRRFVVVRSVVRGKEIPNPRRRVVYSPASSPGSAHPALIASVYGPEVDPASTEPATPLRGARRRRPALSPAREIQGRALVASAGSTARGYAALLAAGFDPTHARLIVARSLD